MCCAQYSGLKLKGQGHTLTRKENFHKSVMKLVSGQQFFHSRMDFKIITIHKCVGHNGDMSCARIRSLGQGHTCQSHDKIVNKWSCPVRNFVIYGWILNFA